MEARIIKYIYEGQEIEFDLNNPNLMINATEMAKIFNAEVKHFMENKSTLNFITACLNTRNSEYLGLRNQDDLYISRQRTGTWMHRVLALKFAAWLDANFEVWVYWTIDQILRGQGPIKEEDTVERKEVLGAIQKENERIAQAQERIRHRNEEDQRIIEEANQNVARHQKQLIRLNKVAVNQLNLFASLN